MGDKVEARAIAISAGVPVVPGYLRYIIIQKILAKLETILKSKA